ncbi:hypothetical protein CEXT_507111 [Caerostris extrusa]|uniref:Uncharacterized protein n=1 Tax=Caerostris extrusa TaxID=172846 RepID=A0AAV4US89_CAEEX|nr:hypothetical protein CEXT_507111 [Caerostris extrusa]
MSPFCPETVKKTCSDKIYNYSISAAVTLSELPEMRGHRSESFKSSFQRTDIISFSSLQCLLTDLKCEEKAITVNHLRIIKDIKFITTRALLVFESQIWNQ